MEFYSRFKLSFQSFKSSSHWMLFTLLVLPLVTFCFTLSPVVLQISKKVANLCLRFTEVSKVNMRAALLKNLRTPRGHFDAPHETLMNQSLESAVLIQRVFLKRRNKCWSMFIFICTSTLTNVPIHGRPFIILIKTRTQSFNLDQHNIAVANRNFYRVLFIIEHMLTLF